MAWPQAERPGYVAQLGGALSDGVRETGSVSNVTPTAAGSSPSPPQGLLLRTEFFRLDWTLRFTRTTVTIDGHPYELPWGENFFPLEPGCHQLEVSYRYRRLSRAG